MALQDNLAISQSQFAAESSALNLVSEKDKKKQREELAHLASILVALKEALSGAKSGESGKAAAKGEGKIVNLGPPSGGSATVGNDNGLRSLADAMAEMEMILQLLQMTIVQEGQKKATIDQNIAQIQVQLSKANLEKTVEQLQKIATMSFWEKIAEWFVAAVSAIAAFVTLNPELLAITVLSVLAATGALSALTSGISSLLQDMGVPKDDANIAASVFVVVLTIVCSFGLGSISAPEAVAENAGEIEMEQITEEVTEEVASQVGQAGAEGANGSSSTLQKALGFLKQLSSRLSPGVKAAIVGGFQSISSTGLFTNIVEATKTSDQEKQNIEEILGIVVAVLAVIATIGASLSTAGNATSKITEKLVKEAGSIFKILSYSQAAGGLAQGSFSIAQGVFEKFLADAKAGFELLQAQQKMTSAQTADDQKTMSTVLKSIGVDPKTIRELVAGDAAIANLITEHSPV